MRDWRRSPAIALISVLMFAGVELAIPISRLGPPHVAERFAWQMFSNVPSSPEFVVKTPSGSEEIEPSRYLAQNRADLELTDRLPAHLCDVIPAAIRVIWETGDYECSTG